MFWGQMPIWGHLGVTGATVTRSVYRSSLRFIFTKSIKALQQFRVMYQPFYFHLDFPGWYLPDMTTLGFIAMQDVFYFLLRWCHLLMKPFAEFMSHFSDLGIGPIMLYALPLCSCEGQGMDVGNGYHVPWVTNCDPLWQNSERGSFVTFSTFNIKWNTSN